MSQKGARARNRQRQAQQRSQPVLRAVPAQQGAAVSVATDTSFDGTLDRAIAAGEDATRRLFPGHQPGEVVNLHDLDHDAEAERIHQGISTTLIVTRRRVHRDVIERRALDVAGDCLADRDLPGALSVLASAARRLDAMAGQP